jgi:hypothetical protein
VQALARRRHVEEADVLAHQIRSLSQATSGASAGGIA